MLHVVVVSESWAAGPFPLSIHYHVSAGECVSTCPLEFRKHWYEHSCFLLAKDEGRLAPDTSELKDFIAWTGLVRA